MGFSEMNLGAEKLVPAEYWCSYGILFVQVLFTGFNHYHSSVKAWGGGGGTRPKLVTMHVHQNTE